MRKEQSERNDLFHLTTLLLMTASFHSPLPEGGSWRDINQYGQQISLMLFSIPSKGQSVSPSNHD